jgi:hypothetical protein
MKLTNDFVQSIKNLNFPIESLLQRIDFQPDNLYAADQDPNQLFIRDQCQSILRLLEGIHSKIEYLRRPIKDEGILYKNLSDRYVIDGKYDYEFTSGSGIEVLIYDDWDAKEKWVLTRVEHNGGEYYLFDYKNIQMDGLLARRR